MATTGMLVLSRQRDESIIIGDNIKITVVDIRGDKVRLGIQAPREIPVHRLEIAEAIHRESMAAEGSDPDDPDRVPPWKLYERRQGHLAP